MTAKLYAINPCAERHIQKAKELLAAACDAVEGLENQVAGYVVIAWDDRGGSTVDISAGGIVRWDGIPVHVQTQLSRIMAASQINEAMKIVKPPGGAS